MATMKELGLDADDYVHYIKGTEMDEWKIKAFEEHWFDDDFLGSEKYETKTDTKENKA